MEENKRLDQGFDDPERQVIKNNNVHFTDAPEIQHFAMEKVNKNDNVYGITWGNLVKEYLNTAYLEEGSRAEVVSFGVTYKVLKRGEVTAFYDADGNTLFDVENKRLEKEYGYLRNDSDSIAESQNHENSNAYENRWDDIVKEYLKAAYFSEDLKGPVASWKVDGEVTVFYDADGNTLFDVENEKLESEYGCMVNEPDDEYENSEPITPMGKAIASIERQAFESAVPEPITESKNPEDVKEKNQKSSIYIGVVGAVTKLQEELKMAKSKEFAEPVIEHLIERCKESESLASDICQNHKTWEKCFDYIYAQARKQTKGNSCAVRDEVVFEWAEDYYHKDDKAGKENKTQKSADQKKENDKKKSDVKTQQKTVQDKKKDDKKDAVTQKDAKKVDVAKNAQTTEKPKPKKNEIEGQLDMFSMFGM